VVVIVGTTVISLVGVGLVKAWIFELELFVRVSTLKPRCKPRDPRGEVMIKYSAISLFVLDLTLSPSHPNLALLSGSLRLACAFLFFHHLSNIIFAWTTPAS